LGNGFRLVPFGGGELVFNPTLQKPVVTFLGYSFFPPMTHLELLEFGFAISETSVSKYLVVAMDTGFTVPVT
jgi:hypothetical protein